MNKSAQIACVPCDLSQDASTEKHFWAHWGKDMQWGPLNAHGSTPWNVELCSSRKSEIFVYLYGREKEGLCLKEQPRLESRTPLTMNSKYPG